MFTYLKTGCHCIGNIVQLRLSYYKSLAISVNVAQVIVPEAPKRIFAK